MKEKWKRIWSRAAPAVKRAASRTAPVLGRVVKRTAQAVGLYLDDLMLVGAGVCFTRAAWELLGRPWALVAAGVCLALYALVIARSRRGGER